jgi:predicted porin
MQKKLLAAAVLSTLSGAAFAQSANVTIYGTLYSQFEYGSATGGDTSLAPTTGASPIRGGASNATGAATSNGVPYTASPADPSGRFRTNGAGANFGLRGTEDLGNGLQAWFQLEMGTSGAMGGTNASSATSLTGWQAVTYRNSAIGMRGNSWGSALIGIWDTPFTTAYGQAALVPKLLSLNAANASAGFYGTSPMAAGGTFSGTSINQACTAAGPGTGSAATCLTAVQNQDRRQSGTIQYWTPNWGGFEGRIMFTPSQENFTASNNNQAVTAGGPSAPPTLKPYMWGVSLNYGIAGFFGSYAYQRMKDVTAAGVHGIGGIALDGIAGQTSLMRVDMSGSLQEAHRVGLKYKFPFGLGIGGRFEYQKSRYDYANAPAAGDGLLTGWTKKVWGLSVSYEAGPHAVEFDFNKIPNSTFSGSNGTANNQSFSGDGTGARNWMLAYNYSLSKRTDLQAYYVQTYNDANARYTGQVFNGLATTPGSDPRFFGVGMRHTF